jgi:hypothetical protein
MLKTMARLWRLLTNPPRPPNPTPQPLHLTFLCRVCHQSFQHPVRRLYLDVAVSRRYQGRQRPTLAPGEVTIPEPIVCPSCATVNQFEIAASAYLPLGAALLRARVGHYHPDEPVQFINLFTKPATSDQTRRRSRKPRSPA